MHEQPATMHRQTSVTVRHEDLLVVKRQTPQCPEVFTRQRMSPTSRPGTASAGPAPPRVWVGLRPDLPATTPASTASKEPRPRLNRERASALGQVVWVQVTSRW